MPVINRIAALADEMRGWRRHIHAHPELGFDCHETAAFVAERLREFGVDEIHEGIATSGLVAIINGQEEGATVALRADMDALPIEEETGADHASTRPGVMHACGHDGHTAMLLGAAKYLCETRNFAGRVALVFQPAEEDGGGGGVMVDEGIMDRFDVAEVYGIHNMPGAPVGSFSTGPGPIMASVDTFHIHVRGRGGHVAHPQDAADPIPCAVAIVQSVQTVLTRGLRPGEEMVLSVTQFHAGSAENIIPETAYLNGTVRCFKPELRDLAETRLREICAGQAAAHGVEAELVFERWYPPVVNDEARASFAAEVAESISGAHMVTYEESRDMGAEDFAYMLQARPGAFLFLGQGDTAGVHHPAYDFNDDIAPVGASFFAKLVEAALPLTR